MSPRNIRYIGASIASGCVWTAKGDIHLFESANAVMGFNWQDSDVRDMLLLDGTGNKKVDVTFSGPDGTGNKKVDVTFSGPEFRSLALIAAGIVSFTHAVASLIRWNAVIRPHLVIRSHATPCTFAECSSDRPASVHFLPVDSTHPIPTTTEDNVIEGYDAPLRRMTSQLNVTQLS